MAAELSHPRLPQQSAGRRYGAPWVLMYHSVADEEDDPYLLTVSPERFAAQMRWLPVAAARRQHARPAGRAGGRGARRLVGLTFDDGYADFARHVVPVLRGYGFTATAYVVADRLGGDNGWDVKGPRKQLLTVDQVRELAASGWEIGSHGLSHRALPGVPAQVLRAEVQHSREALEELVGGPVTGFCYPYGAVDEPATRAVAAAGYDYAVAIGHSVLAGRFALPRCYVGDRDGAWRLRAKRGRHGLRDVVTELRRAGRGFER